MARRKYKYVKPAKRRGSARTLETKYKSMQTCWRRATDRQGTLTIAEAKEIVERGVTCPYCKLAVQAMDLSIDHMVPRSRGGSSDPENLQWCCKICNGLKSDLTDIEYNGLLEFLATLPTEARSSILTRLRAGGYIRYRRRK